MRGGLWGFVGGLALFAIGFLFFEGVVGLSDFDVDLPEWVLPAALITIVVVLLRDVFERAEPEAP